jgi:hypothetical protein
MYCQIIKFECQPGQEDATRLKLDRFMQAARLNPGYVHGSYFVPESLPGGKVPGGFAIKDLARTYVVYLAFESPRDMLRHIELYHGEDVDLLPSPHDYLLGVFKENPDAEVENRYD